MNNVINFIEYKLSKITGSPNGHNHYWLKINETEIMLFENDDMEMGMEDNLKYMLKLLLQCTNYYGIEELLTEDSMVYEGYSAILLCETLDEFSDLNL